MIGSCNTMSVENKSISAGTAAIIVYDESLRGNPKAEFYQWLFSEGFTMWEHTKGAYESVCWIYVNLNSKVIARGMPGIPITKELGNHAVTIDEFKTIYSIFKKYDGKRVLEF